MSYGVIEYNDEGMPKCEICGEYFDRVSTHVRQVHDMSAREYKKQFGFDLIKGICSQNSAARTRVHTMSNYDTVIAENLLKQGENTRFTKGSQGRTRDKVSEQTRRMLIAKSNFIKK